MRISRNENARIRVFMKQYEYFAADYRTGKKQLKKEFVNDMVALFENENATIDDMRKGRKVLKAQFKADKKALKSKSKALEKAFRKDYGMLRRPIMADIFDFFEEDRAEPNGRTPFNKEIKIEKDVVYKTAQGKELVMDINYPSHPVAEKSPCVMDIPGGGWMIHNRLRRDGYARCFAAMGAVVAVIDHRLCPEVFFPKDLEDCIDAYNFLCDNKERFGIDENNITVTGDSSGGHLAACIGCAATSDEYVKTLGIPTTKTKPAGLIIVSGAFSFEVMYRIPLTNTLIVRYVSGKKSRKAFRNWEFYKQSDPYNYLNAEFPPCYNSGGMTDFLCLGEAKRMGEALSKAGVKNEYTVGKNLFRSDHCYVLRFPYAPARKDALALYNWYFRLEKDLGIDMSEGYKRVETFMTQYKKSLSGEIKC